jgi:phytoene dehydrogenase-like protein
MARIIVIGAGMGGMAAAARLKVKGHDVTVIEASDTHGGKLGTFRRDGFAFDTGPSLFTIPAVYRDLFLKTGGPL